MVGPILLIKVVHVPGSGHEHTEYVFRNGTRAYDKTKRIINVPEKRVRAKIYLRSKESGGTLFNNNNRAGSYAKGRHTVDYSYEFYREMTESEAKKYGLEYEYIT